MTEFKYFIKVISFEVKMEHIYSNYSASISELKKNPSALIDESNGSPIAVLNHNKPTAYLVPASTFEKILEDLDDLELIKSAKKRLKSSSRTIKVSLDEL